MGHGKEAKELLRFPPHLGRPPTAATAKQRAEGCDFAHVQITHTLKELGLKSSSSFSAAGKLIL